ncbi:MAG: virulence-associated protein E, partial [Clostridia bacterium]|nr:virulence-associated protein E [Clostridia bacterium]
MTPDEITENLKTNSQGKILCSISNITYALENDEILEGAVAINDLTERVDIIKPLPWHRNGSMLDDMDLNYITQRLEDLYGFSNDKKIRKAVGIVANNNHYHP